MNEGLNRERQQSGVEDPFQNWTDAQRMEEFMETGDPVYLTPDLAERMGITLDENGQIVFDESEASVDSSEHNEDHAVEVADQPPLLDCEKIRTEGLQNPATQRAFQIYLKEHGWRALIDSAYNDKYLGIDVLQFCARNYSSYEYLSDQELDQIMELKFDAFTYTMLEDIREFRLNIQKYLHTFDPNELTVLLNEHQIEFRNLEVLNEKIAAILKENPDLRQEAIARQVDWIERVNDLPAPDYVDLSDEELASRLFTAFQMDIIFSHLKLNHVDVTNEQVVAEALAGIYPEEEELKKIAAQAIKTSPGFYNEFAMHCKPTEVTLGSATQHEAVAVFPVVESAARERFPHNLDMQMRYTLNTSVVHLAKNIYLITSPDGEFIDIVQGPEQWYVEEFADGEIPINVCLHLLALISDENGPTMEGVAEALYGNWEQFPRYIQEEARALGITPYQGEVTLRDYRMLHDMTARAGVASKLSPDLAQKIVMLLEDSISESYVMFNPRLDIDHAADMVRYYDSSAEGRVLGSADLEQLVKLLSPSLIANLEKRLGISFKELTSMREFLALCSYLRSVNSSEPFATVEAIMHEASDPEDRMNRLKVFLLNVFDETAVENVTIFAHLIESEYVQRAFRSLAHSVESTASLKTFMHNPHELSSPNVADQIFENAIEFDQETIELVEQLDLGLLRRASHLFAAGKQMALWEYSGEESTTDLIVAYEGVALMQDILARMGSGKGLTIERDQSREGSLQINEETKTQSFFFRIKDDFAGHQLALKVFVRPEADQRGEARVNFELILDELPEASELRQAFLQTTEFFGTSGKGRKRTITQSVIRFGFDLDTSSHPPVFSFDMGRSAYEDEHMKRTGDVLGNILTKVAAEGHHLTQFDKQFSDPEQFRKVAEGFITYFNIASYHTTPPADAESFRAVAAE